MRRLALLVAVAVVATAPVLVAPVTAGADPGVPAVEYRPPVDGPVTDGFREPDGPYGAGNRGIDYATDPGAPVRAAAHGEVTFAGQVGGTRHVVVLHADGVRTTYAFLRTISVRRGELVRRGQTVGTSGPSLHFGARVGGTYIDPRTLFDPGPVQVHLVPDEVRRPGPEAVERAAVAAFLGPRAFGPAEETGPGGWFGRAAAWLGDRVADGTRWALDWGRGKARDYAHELRGVLHYGDVLTRPFTMGLRTLAAVPGWWRQRHDCTPGSDEPPPLPERRVAVLVGGLGSSSEGAAIDELDAAALGYKPDDVLRFSYRGGTTADTPYDPTDTTVDLRESARRFRDLLEAVEAANPGVPIDIIAHSQGGLVARQALAFEYDKDDADLPPVANLVTIGTPHRGADLATALAMTGFTTAGDLLQRGYHAVRPDEVDPRGESLRQMSEVSEFIRKLNRRPLPASVNVTSIGARADWVVPAGRTQVDGARNVVVDVAGLLTDHDRLPSSPQARREVALAIGGAPPTCQSLTDMLADTAVSESISYWQDLVGAGLYAGGTYADRSVRRSATAKATEILHRRTKGNR